MTPVPPPASLHLDQEQCTPTPVSSPGCVKHSNKAVYSDSVSYQFKPYKPGLNAMQLSLIISGHTWGEAWEPMYFCITFES